MLFLVWLETSAVAIGYWFPTVEHFSAILLKDAKIFRCKCAKSPLNCVEYLFVQRPISRILRGPSLHGM